MLAAGAGMPSSAPPTPLQITPPDLNPTVPIGYNAASGTVDPSNTTGATGVALQAPGTCAAGLVWDPNNETCYSCASIGQNFDAVNQVCVAPPNYTPYIVFGLIGALAVFMMLRS